MFKIFINDGNQEIPKDDIFYIVSKEGIFLKKKLGLLESITPVNQISILNNLNIVSKAKMNIPKISTIKFLKIITFFRKVYELYKGEAIVLIYYNELSKKFKLYAPTQTVSSCSLDYSINNIPNYNLIGDIHSHGSLSAFHSGVDSHDEKEFDGLHITLGNINNSDLSFSISSSIVINGSRFITEPGEYIQGIVQFNKDGIFYIVESSNIIKAKFNKKWLKNVSKKEILPININSFDFSRIRNQKIIDSLSFGSDNNNNTDDDFNPCKECVFKDYKIDLMLEKMTQEIDEDEDNLNLMNYL